MWTILAFVGGFATCLTVFVFAAVFAGNRMDELLYEDILGPEDEAELQISLSEHVRELNAERH